jgi:hypothetical protein
VRKAIAPVLAPEIECVELADLMPVPAAPTIAWRQRAAEAAVRRALTLQPQDRHLLLSGDPVAAGELAAAPSSTALDAIAVCLLDVGAATQASRLRARGDDPALLHHHQAFAEWMRGHALDPAHRLEVLSTGGWSEMRWNRLARPGPRWGMHTIDTSCMSTSEVAAQVTDWCRNALARTVPIIVPWAAD